MSYRKIVDER